MRLIDAERLIDGKGVFSRHIDLDFEKGIASLRLEKLMSIIEDSPTAYDLDKVLEQLKEEEKAALDLCDNNASYNAYCKAVQIVKSGGVSYRGTESRKLQPCPFCGGIAEARQENKDGQRIVWCECVKCHAKTNGYRLDLYNGGLSVDDVERFFDLAIKEWNMRI
ncbi:MAG: hypothetical protein HFH62_04650 [Lachnospiraceae bacterium]|nr:hypothetical protein [Lachnospiraceae bacterium]